MMKVKALAILMIVCAGSTFAQNGVIRELAGTVELKRAGQAEFVPAKQGDALAQDTVISTGFKSTALVVMGSAVITVRPLTRLSLAELSAASGTETINVNLQTGRVRVDVNPPAGTRTNMTVRGPSATASVRGTGFDFDTLNLKVRHGKVAYTGSKGGTTIVRSGSSSKVSKNGKASDPADAAAADLIPAAPAGSGSTNSRGRQPDAADVTITIDYGV
jgi:hypothetical protein